MTTQELARFLAAVTPAKRRRDAHTMLALMERVTGVEPVLWGTAIGFGSYHYRYESGREGDAAAAAFAPRKAATVVYLMDGVGAHEHELGRLGPHTTGVGCLYLKDLEQVDLIGPRTHRRHVVAHLDPRHLHPAGPRGRSELTP